MSAPHVAGLAAYILGLPGNSRMTPDQVLQVMKQWARNDVLAGIREFFISEIDLGLSDLSIERGGWHGSGGYGQSARGQRCHSVIVWWIWDLSSDFVSVLVIFDCNFRVYIFRYPPF